MNDGITPSEIANKIHIRRNNVYSYLKKMVEEGLITRIEDRYFYVYKKD